MRSLQINNAAKTHPGHKRAVNEDAIYSDCDQRLWAVADGMGGYAAGDVASQIVVQALAGISMFGSITESINVIEQAIQRANNQLLFNVTLPPDCKQIGTTVIVLTYHPEDNLCACLWVGDSRLYALRNNALFQITKDHSIVQEMVDKGLLDLEQRDSHPNSHVITRAVGVCDQLDIDVVTFKPEKGDMYILCSDGLYNEVSADKMLSCVASIQESALFDANACDEIAGSLVSEVLKTPARDNVSVNVVVLG